MRIRRDAGLAAAVFALNAVTAVLNTDGDDRSLAPLGWALLMLSSLALLGRWRFPIIVLTVTGATTVVYYPSDFPDTAIALNLAIALYTVGRTRGPAWSSGAAVLLLALVAAASGEPGPIAISVAPILALPVALGELVRSRDRQAERAEEKAALAETSRALAEESRALAERSRAAAEESRVLAEKSRALAEASRESEALRRAAEERLRIAREMHDAIGHQLSLISVQAAAALHTREPDSAFAALQAIRDAGKDALREMREVLGVLRDPVQPDLAALPSLFRRTSAAGLAVRPSIDVPPLPPGVQRTAYRIVQEALTNAVRHATATSAEVVIRQAGGRLVVTVCDDGAPVDGPPPANEPPSNGPPANEPPSNGPPANEPPGSGLTGSGLRGMAERAAAAGGDLEAGPQPGGGFRVQATLPLDENGPR